METLCGRDSQQIKDNISAESGNVDWAKVLLDQTTDDMIIIVSREKIAHEIIRLRQMVNKPPPTANSNSSASMLPPTKKVPSFLKPKKSMNIYGNSSSRSSRLQQSKQTGYSTPLYESNGSEYR